ncbi:hypothetical protein [Pedobacter sp. L105]|uniref:hypothetical protein n=1 Tax=Pedobacter sp. L105 TaxID=1641871 RepID=UPI00131C444B|nr:hypothetical protein [Pedobacter sp. L105]
MCNSGKSSVVTKAHSLAIIIDKHGISDHEKAKEIKSKIEELENLLASMKEECDINIRGY